MHQDAAHWFRPAWLLKMLNQSLCEVAVITDHGTLLWTTADTHDGMGIDDIEGLASVCPSVHEAPQLWAVLPCMWFWLLWDTPCCPPEPVPLHALSRLALSSLSSFLLFNTVLYKTYTK